MSGRRAFVLVAALMVCLILCALGLGFLTKKGLQYQGAFLAGEAAQARELALAGLEDARTKLDRDLAFPLASGTDQESFSYTETVTDKTSGTPVGSYSVDMDLRFRKLPYGVLRITCVGRAGPGPEPRSRHKIYAELDVSPVLRTDVAQPNPRYFLFIQRQDLGSP